MKVDIAAHARKEPSDVYHARPEMSASKVKAVLRSLAHFKSEFIDEEGKKDTPSLRFGTIVHTALLEPARFMKCHVIEPALNKNTNAFKDWKAALHPEAIPLSAGDADAVVRIIHAVKAHPVASSLLAKGIAEHSYFFTEAQTGVACKMRPDYLTEDGWIVDIKTAHDASREAFTRAIGQHRYDISAGLYSEGFRTIFGQMPRGYVYVACETDAPYCCAVYVADETVCEKGLEDARRALWLYKHAAERNEWPGYQSTEAENISLPHWMLLD